MGTAPHRLRNPCKAPHRSRFPSEPAGFFRIPESRFKPSDIPEQKTISGIFLTIQTAPTLMSPARQALYHSPLYDTTQKASQEPYVTPHIALKMAASIFSIGSHLYLQSNLFFSNLRPALIT